MTNTTTWCARPSAATSTTGEPTGAARHSTLATSRAARCTSVPAATAAGSRRRTRSDSRPPHPGSGPTARGSFRLASSPRTRRRGLWRAGATLAGAISLATTPPQACAQCCFACVRHTTLPPHTRACPPCAAQCDTCASLRFAPRIRALVYWPIGPHWRIVALSLHWRIGATRRDASSTLMVPNAQCPRCPNARRAGTHPA